MISKSEANEMSVDKYTAELKDLIDKGTIIPTAQLAADLETKVIDISPNIIAQLEAAETCIKAYLEWDEKDRKKGSDHASNTEVWNALMVLRSSLKNYQDIKDKANRP